MEYQIYLQPPSNFQPSMKVAGCYCQFEQQILLLKRHPNKSYGNCWGVTAGKLEGNEAPKEAMIREVFEEVGIELKENDSNLVQMETLYIVQKDISYIFYLFWKKFSERPEIRLAFDEHLEYRWVTIEEAKKLPLVVAGADAIDYYVRFLERNKMCC